MPPDPPTALPDDAAPVFLARRLVAIVYDALIIAGLVLFVLALLIIPLGLALGQEQWEQVQQTWWMRLATQLVTLSVIVGFHVGFWVQGGQTLGMRAWHFKVLREDGGRLTLRQALVRYVASWASGLALGLGFLSALWDAEGRTWHDRRTGTRLVKSKAW
jgi:uncharacterized RDD family membrane protein YckC